MDAQQRRRAVRDRLLVIRRAGAVGRAHLNQLRAGLPQHVGDAEAAADLDRLPAADDHLPISHVRSQRQIERGGVVVDDQRGLRAGQRAQQLIKMVRAAAPLAAFEIEFEIRIARRFLHRGGCGVAQRGASEVGVNHHAGRVDHRPQTRREARAEPCRDRFGDRVKRRRRRVALRRQNPGAPLLKLLAHRVCDQLRGQRQPPNRRVREHAVDAGQGAERMRHLRPVRGVSGVYLA